MDTIEILKAAVNKDPAGVKAAFDACLTPKISAAVELRKKEIAANLFNKAPDVA